MASYIAFLPENLLDCLCLKLAQHFCSFSHFEGVQNVFSWLFPSCFFMTLFFLNKSKRLWRLYFGDKLLPFYNISVHCALMSLSRKRAALLSLIFICCALTLPLPRNPKSQSKGDMKTETNVCKIFFLRKLPLRQFFLEGYFQLKNSCPLHAFPTFAPTVE